MTNGHETERLEKQIRAALDAEVPARVERASRVRLQHFIPAHWFAAAGSECASMYVAGFFYGSISIAQAYVEALSLFLAEAHRVRISNDCPARWQRLYREKVVSSAVSEAAVSVLADRNDFHHLNKQIEREYLKLAARSEECVRHLHTIESEVFAYTIDVPGKLTLRNPRYWPSGGEGTAQVNLRQLW